MKIVILDGYTVNPGDLSWDSLKEYGELTVYDRTPHEMEAIIGRIGDAELVFTNKVPITEAVLDACPQLRFIGVQATGYNVVDCEAAKKRGIPVCNVPAYGTMAVAQFAIGLLLELCHHAAHHSQAVHEGRWEKSPDFCFWDYPLVELAGKTMGIIGFGSIGRQVGLLAKALGMELLACTRTIREEDKGLAEFVDLDTLLGRSDVISLHCPLFPETAGLICNETLAKMKDGVILINNSRGGLVVEADLARALKSGKVAAAGLDVVSTEPIQGDNPLLTAPNCLITPHISWAARDCRQRIIDRCTANLAAFLRESPECVVNG